MKVDRGRFQFRGELLRLHEIANIVGMNHSKLYHRVVKLGMSVEDAIATKRVNPPRKLYEFGDEQLTLEDVASRLGVSVTTVIRRRVGNRIMDDAEYQAMEKADHPRAKRYFYKGDSLTIPEWSKKTGIPYWTLYARICRYGWTLEQALTTPLLDTTYDTINYCGKTMTVSQWAQAVGMPTDALRLRLTRYGWPVERALTEPLNGLMDRNVMRRNRRLIRRIAANFDTPTMERHA